LFIILRRDQGQAAPLAPHGRALLQQLTAGVLQAASALLTMIHCTGQLRLISRTFNIFTFVAHADELHKQCGTSAKQCLDTFCHWLVHAIVFIAG
jgi:hypothetical protein